ncbi:sensor domain-containing protein [Streptosporangium canum]|uniref:sensor domain-containing protein n=1 Tax=Streptosporangium canum TaxID=324952 RepID=UPI0036AA3306
MHHPRNALQALAGRPLRFLWSAWPWRSLAYLLSGAVFGAAAALVVSVALAAGVVAAVALVAVAVVPCGPVAGRFERWRLRLVDRAPAADPHGRPGAAGPRARLREQATWREAGYTLLSVLALWWVDLGAIAVGGVLPGVLLSAPLQPDTPCPSACPWPWPER